MKFFKFSPKNPQTDKFVSAFVETFFEDLDCFESIVRVMPSFDKRLYNFYLINIQILRSHVNLRNYTLLHLLPCSERRKRVGYQYLSQQRAYPPEFCVSVFMTVKSYNGSSYVSLHVEM